jgi:hypothetical protein
MNLPEIILLPPVNSLNEIESWRTDPGEGHLIFHARCRIMQMFIGLK